MACTRPDDDCIHSSTSPDYVVDGDAATLVVITCDDCGQKVSSCLIPKGR